MKPIIFILIISLHSFCSLAQEPLKKQFFGAWINYKLKNILETKSTGDSSFYIIPRFLYINCNEIKIQYRFEQEIKKYKIKNIKKNIFYFNRGNFFLNADTIILNDRYLGTCKFIKHRKE